MLLSLITISLSTASGLANPDYEFEVAAFDYEYIELEVYDGMAFDLEVHVTTGNIDVYLTDDLEAWNPLLDTADFDEVEYLFEIFEVTGEDYTLYIIFDNDHLLDAAYVHVNITVVTSNLLFFLLLGGAAIVGVILMIVFTAKKQKVQA